MAPQGILKMACCEAKRKSNGNMNGLQRHCNRKMSGENFVNMGEMRKLSVTS